ncbi:MAG: DUF2207 domain-containing protein [Acetobacteraceae bacterium]
MLRVVLSAALLLLSLSAPAVALERITDFVSEVRIAPNGLLTVRETISVWVERSRIRHGIFRDFPTTYTDRFGRRVRVGFRVESVQLDGHDEPYEVSAIDSGKRVKIGRADTLVEYGQHRYTLTYTTDRQVRYFEDYDEVYWNATGNEWVFPIERAAAIVDLPRGARILQSAGYTGALGSTARDVRITRLSDTQIRFDTTRPLGVREGLTVAVGFTKGAVAPPSSAFKVFGFIRDNASSLAAAAGFVVALGYYLIAWVRIGRDPERGVIIPLFSAPADLSPAAVRYVSQMGYDNKAFAAALVDMAVKGFLTISESGGTYTLTRTTHADARARLSGDERALIDKLSLMPGSSIELKQSNRRAVQASISAFQAWLIQSAGRPYFRTNRIWAYGGVVIAAAAGIVSAALCDHPEAGGSLIALAIWTFVIGVLLQASWTQWRQVLRPASMRFWTLVRAIGATVLAVGVAVLGAANHFVATAILGWPASIALVGAGALAFLFRHLLTAPTPAGAKVLDQIEGLRMFLEVAERDRLEALHPPDVTPEVFERFLPYAMALDCETAWARKFEAESAAAGRPIEDADSYSPSWYSGSSRWSGVHSFTDDLGPSLASATASASASPSSSSSGSGGGGSSGGGGGGGGGGGW